jgi:hypothetical protein
MQAGIHSLATKLWYNTRLERSNRGKSPDERTHMLSAVADQAQPVRWPNLRGNLTRYLIQAIVFFGIALVATEPLPAQNRPPEQIHTVLAEFIRGAATRPLPAGDTLVSWYKQPILLHLVHRTPDRVEAAMIRGDAYLGTAILSYSEGRPVEGTVLWTSGDSVLVDVRISAQRDSLLIAGTTTAGFPVPSGAWGIADYGMEDLLVPTLRSLSKMPSPWTVLAYRPFAAKWDTLTVTSVPVGTASYYTLAEPDGKRDWWADYQRLLPMLPK